MRECICACVPSAAGVGDAEIRRGGSQDYPFRQTTGAGNLTCFMNATIYCHHNSIHFLAIFPINLQPFLPLLRAL